jgi:ATPase subunit of ABC transporter with duplicated ATPase domains
MNHNPILINNIGLSFPQKTCFLNFSTQINSRMRIGIIGRNGSGKSNLLKIIQGQIDPSEGEIKIPKNIVFGYLPQFINKFFDESGSERFNKALNQALAINPSILLLDEPSNHLDINNRQSLLHIINSYSGSLIIASHDINLLSNSVDILWCIDDEKVQIFRGSYDNYILEKTRKHFAIKQELALIHQKAKECHYALMKEQIRAKKGKKQGEKHKKQRRWPTVVSATKIGRAVETTGKKKKQINTRKQELVDTLSELKMSKIIRPKFSLLVKKMNKTILFIVDGSIGYQKPIINNINFIVGGDEKVAIVGNNGSGKSTLVKSILNTPNITKSGEWYTPAIDDIGYLDQHYNNLDLNSTLFEEISDLVPSWPQFKIRQHLNDFLFHKNEEVNALMETFSGGEKVRACLAKIVAKAPKLVILDEITNNLDIETKNHVVEVLKNYLGSVIIISHDEDFLNQIGINTFYLIKNGCLSQH